MTSDFSDDQNAVRRKEFFVLVTMNPEAIGTSEFNTIERKKFQISEETSQAKTLAIKKLKRNRQKFENFFVNFQAPFLRRLLTYIYTYYIKLLYVQQFDSDDRQIIYTLIISLLIEKPFYLLSPQSFSFQIVSEFIDTFVKFSNFMSRRWGF